MKHILENTKQEIRTTQEYVSINKLWIFFKFFYKKYASQKESILMYYSSVYSDIQKDISDPKVSAHHVEDTRQSLIYITQWIEKITSTLSNIKKFHNHKKLYKTESIFLLNLVESFNADVHMWLDIHANELGKTISEVSQVQQDAISWAWVLAIQKKRLEIHINNINNI